MESEAERLRHWTRDLEVRGSIPAAPVMGESIWLSLNRHCRWSPCSNGYMVQGTTVGSTVSATCHVDLASRMKIWWIFYRYLNAKQILLSFTFTIYLPLIFTFYFYNLHFTFTIYILLYNLHFTLQFTFYLYHLPLPFTFTCTIYLYHLAFKITFYLYHLHFTFTIYILYLPFTFYLYH